MTLSAHFAEFKGKGFTQNIKKPPRFIVSQSCNALKGLWTPPFHKKEKKRRKQKKNEWNSV